MAGFGWVRKSMYRVRDRFFTRPMHPLPFHFAMLSHPGCVRKGNEDTCAANPELGVFVVCDGMGGAAAGEIASRLASEAFLATLAPAPSATPRTATPDVRLADAVHAANDAVYRHSRRSVQLEGMGTTLVALLLELDPANPERPSLTLAHVGDSRCYLYRDGLLTQLTEDHSLVEEHVRMGEMTPEEAAVHPMRNIITRAIGSHPFVEPDLARLEPAPGDLYLLASDGLTRELTDTAIAQSLTRVFARAANRQPDLHSLARTLIDQANDAGGGDNITVLLMQLPPATPTT